MTHDGGMVYYSSPYSTHCDKAHIVPLCRHSVLMLAGSDLNAPLAAAVPVDNSSSAFKIAGGHEYGPRHETLWRLVFLTWQSVWAWAEDVFCAGMNVPPQVMGVMAKVQSSSVGGMLSSMGQRIRPWTTDFGVCSSLCVSSLSCPGSALVSTGPS